MTSLKYTVKGLDEEETYEFRISAENKAGVGPCSENSNPTRAAPVIGKIIKYLIYLTVII